MRRLNMLSVCRPPRAASSASRPFHRGDDRHGAPGSVTVGPVLPTSPFTIYTHLAEIICTVGNLQIADLPMFLADDGLQSARASSSFRHDYEKASASLDDPLL